MPKQSDDLSREGEQSQETKSGLRIPVPKRTEFGKFIKGLKRQKDDASQSDQGKRQTSPDQ
jgi:hypothetical protein